MSSHIASSGFVKHALTLGLLLAVVQQLQCDQGQPPDRAGGSLLEFGNAVLPIAGARNDIFLQY